MEKLTRTLSNGMFNLMYAGVVCGGTFTFTKGSDKRWTLFMENAALHFMFVANGFALAYLKF